MVDQLTFPEEIIDPPLYHTLDDKAPNGAVPADQPVTGSQDPAQRPGQPAEPAGEPPNMAGSQPSQGDPPTAQPQRLNTGTYVQNNFYYGSNSTNPTATAAKTLLLYLKNGVRPADRWPGPYPRALGADSFEALEPTLSTTIRQLHENCGSNGAGKGFQIVWRCANNTWLPGPIFEWGRGDESQTIGTTTLGRSRPGQGIFISSWGQ